MSFLSKEKELDEFITTKVKNIDDLDIHKVMFFYNKIIREGILQTYERLNNLEWGIECSKLVFNIYWIVLSYSYNIKLAMFLCERALLLFNEYIDLASKTITEGMNFKINMTDVKLFIYKRTIGTIKMNEDINKDKTNLLKVKEATNIITNFINYFINIVSKKIKDVILNNKAEILNYHIENISNILTHIVYKLYLRNITFPFHNYNVELQNSDIEDVPSLINKMKIYGEVLYYIHKKTGQDIDIVFKVFNSIDKTYEFHEELVEYFDIDTNIRKNKYYLFLIKKIDSKLKSKNMKKIDLSNSLQLKIY